MGHSNSNSSDQSTAQEMLRDMPEHRIKKLMEILTTEIPLEPRRLSVVNLENLNPPLYNKNEENKQGYDLWVKFLKTYNIRVIDHRVNGSVTFKLESKENQPKEAFFLKVEDRKGRPRGLENKLRENGWQHLVPISAKRMANISLSNADRINLMLQGDVERLKQGQTLLKPRELILTQYRPEADLIDHSLSHKNVSEDIESRLKLAKDALGLYKQMAEILEDLQKQDVYFTQMQNSNWLVQQDGKGGLELLVSDPKSFEKKGESANCLTPPISVMPTEVYDKLNKKDQEEGLNPHQPFTKADALTTDAATVYMLGSNLLQYLVQSKGDELWVPLNTKAPVFETGIGKKLKGLIERMTHPNPTQRIKLDEVIKEFKTLETTNASIYALKDKIDANHWHFQADAVQDFKRNLNNSPDKPPENYQQKSDLFDLLDKITDYSSGEHDVEMKKFLNDKLDKIQNEETDGLKGELEETLRDLKESDPHIKAVLHTIAELREKGGKGRLKKAENIEKALGKVPFENRGNIHKKGHGVLEEIAAHRHWFRKKAVLHDNEPLKLRNGKESDSFKAFKGKFTELTKQKEQEQKAKITSSSEQGMEPDQPKNPTTLHESRSP